MSKFLKRIASREKAIQEWLKANGHEEILSTIEQCLKTLPQDELAHRFESGIDQSFKFCSNSPGIQALDFSWYYAGRETGEALAYAYDDIKSKGTLAKSDLGPDELPGVEMKSNPNDIVAEHFAALPTHVALNTFVSDIKPLTTDSAADVLVVSTDLINLWNYQRVFEAISACIASEQYSLEGNFWVTLTRHERSSVPIAQIK